MHPSIHAQTQPDKPAYIMAATGETVTYRQLDEQSNRVAQLFRSLGLKPRDHIAIFLENNPRYLRDLLGRAALGAGLHRDQLAADRGRGRVHRERLRRQAVRHLDRPRRQGGRARGPDAGAWRTATSSAARLDGYKRWEDAVAAQPATRIADETAGHDMLYSSGTTGRPKGVLPVDRAAADRRRQSAAADHPQALRHGRADDLSLAGAALSCGSAALQHDGDAARRHVGDHGAFRRRGVPAPRRRSSRSRTRSSCRPCSCACSSCRTRSA